MKCGSGGCSGATKNINSAFKRKIICHIGINGHSGHDFLHAICFNRSATNLASINFTGDAGVVIGRENVATKTNFIVVVIFNFFGVGS